MSLYPQLLQQQTNQREKEIGRISKNRSTLIGYVQKKHSRGC